jgi:hypothetical protein
MTRPSWPASAAVATGLVAFAAYAATAARTITWWEGSSYPLAAVTLGIMPPPGSLLLTLLGWVTSRVPVIQPVAFRLNLTASLLAGATVALATWLSIRLAAPGERRPGTAEIAAGSLAGLAFAFSLSVWSHAVRFTPYVLSAGFTALILAAALAWWRRAADSDARGRLLLVFLLLGLDVSVHRTNALLLPAVLVWVALRRPRAWLRPATWAAVGAGLALGLAFHLLLIPLSLRDPAFDLAEPRDLPRFWSYVSLKFFGGGFLFNVLPRRGDFVHVQLGDYLEFLRINLMPRAPWPPLAFVPAALALLGWLVALRNSPRRSLGLFVFYLCASLGAVVYFNLPPHYFRAMDRHYLPSLVLLVPPLAIGSAALLRLAARAPGAARPVTVAVVAVLLALVPLDAWQANRAACDLSRVRFAETWSRDVFATLPPHAILLTSGDNDTFPLWYLQNAEQVRTDVTVINASLTNTAWFVAQLRRRDPQLAGLLQGRDPPEPAVVRDSIVFLPVGPAARAALPPGARLPDSIAIRLSGTIFGQDAVVLDLLRRNAWRRPVCVACTMAPDNLAWLWPYLRLEGLAYRMTPSPDPAVQDLDPLRGQLLGKVGYAGMADTTIVMDAATQAMCSNYVAALVYLARAQLGKGDARGCLETARFTEAHVPLARLGEHQEAFAGLLRDLCAQAGAQAREGAVVSR